MSAERQELIESADGPLTTPLPPEPFGPVLSLDTSAPPLGWRQRATRRRLKIGLIVWDALVPAAFLSVSAFFGGVIGEQINGGPAQSTDILALVLALAAPVGLAIAGAYNTRRRRGSSRLLFAGRLLLVGIALSWLAIIVSAGAGWPVDFSQMLVLALMLPVGWLIGRAACDRHPVVSADRVLLVGSGEVADRVVSLTARHREYRMSIVGRLDESHTHEPGVAGVPVLGTLSDLPEVLARDHIDRVLVAFTSEPDALLLNRLRACVAEGIQVDVVPRFFDLLGPAPRSHSLGGMPVLEAPGRGLTISQRTVKRTVDLLGAGGILLLLSPLLVVLTAVIAAVDGRPVFFRQTRVGRDGTEFAILKFRTMRTDSDAQGVARQAALADSGHNPLGGAVPIAEVVKELKGSSEERVTRIGAFLRRTSLDELPQLINVVRGEMSLVGPRPLRRFEADFLTPWQRARQDLRPGLTGLWQVLGRSSVEWDDRMQLDYAYVSHWSLASDLRILARTIPAVLRKDGAV